MKGTFFRESLEYRLFIDGESWPQGGKIVGTIQVKNHGAAEVALADLRVVLTEGKDKKVKAKADGAFAELVSLNPLMGRGIIPPGGESEAAPWEFTLDENARVTDKTGGLYVLYGRGAEHAQFGHLPLNVVPRQEFLDFVELMRAVFHFSLKGITSGKKGTVQVKLLPPEGKTFSNVEQLDLTLFKKNGDYQANLEFTTKRVDPASPVLAMKEESRSFERGFSESEFLHSFNQRLKKETVEAFLNECIPQLLEKKALL